MTFMWLSTKFLATGVAIAKGKIFKILKASSALCKLLENADLNSRDVITVS